VTLVGDACHCVSLIAGQGASMAMAGALALADALAAGPDFSAALDGYERRMLPAVRRRQRAGRRFARWFVPDSRVRLALRDLMMRMSTWPVVSQLARRRFAFGEAVKF
jgi:2-polyprenyl-6-methoxyphenol hydroxylase-like FAD-dependent oxidoreductase